MKILGIHDGHASGICYLKDGRVVAAVNEERLTKVKNQGGFPQFSLHWLLNNYGISVKDLDAIGVATESFTLKSTDAYRSGRHKIFPYFVRLAPGLAGSNFLIDKAVALQAPRRERKFLQANSQILGFDKKKIGFLDHHLCHTAAALYASGFDKKSRDLLIISYDGSGDGLCATFSTFRNSKLQRIHRINSFNSIAILYSRVTQYLGMKPLEHEYKLMGMAPYVDEKRTEELRRVFEKYITLSSDGLSTKNISRVWGNGYLKKFRKDFYLKRFDWIAGGLQRHFENIMLDLIKNWVKKTGIKNLLFTGGAFMNVKLNKLILEMPEIEDAYFMPSCGDESLAIGAAYLANEKQKEGSSLPISDLYLGNQISEEEIVKTLEEFKDKVGFEKIDNINARIARELADLKIIARASGRMEWGARALGNRSIMANPSRLEIVHKINKAIKMRDFWMPFTPSILEEDRKLYCVNPRDFPAPYMIVSFNSTPLAQKHLIAALHPFDLTMRPQFVSAEWNPGYHNIISEFKKLTGIGGVLNTSFNLHGWPMVCDARDAITTLISSGLDFLALENYLIWKKK